MITLLTRLKKWLDRFLDLRHNAETRKLLALVKDPETVYWLPVPNGGPLEVSGLRMVEVRPGVVQVQYEILNNSVGAWCGVCEGSHLPVAYHSGEPPTRTVIV